MANFFENVKVALEQGGYDYDIPRIGEVYIRFKNLTIRNSEQGNCPISEMFVYLGIGETYVYDFNGARYEYREVDAANSYRHSHLPTGVTPNFSEFCKGSGEITNYFSAGKFANTVEGAAMFLFMVEAFLEWESLEGGPYTQMSNLNTYDRVVTDTVAEQVLVNGKIPIKDNFIDFNIVNNKVEISETWVRNQLSPNCVERDGVYYLPRSSNSNDMSEAANIDRLLKNFGPTFESRNFVFKGEKQKLRIISNSKLVEGDKIIHPKTIKAYANRISKELTKHILSKEN